MQQENDSDVRPKRKGFLRGVLRVVDILGLLALAVLVIVAVVALFASTLHAGELLANLRWQQGLVAVPLLAWMLLRRRPLAALLAGVVVLWHVYPVLFLYLPQESPPEEAVLLKVISANLWMGNHETAKVRQWLSENPSDVVALLEVGPWWLDELERLENIYPHQERFTAKPATWPGTNWDMVVLSRYPLEGFESHDMGPHVVPYIEGFVRMGHGRIHLVVVHALPPWQKENWGHRNCMLEHVVDRVTWTRQSVVVGDFNATIYSPAFRDFLAGAGLKDTRRGFGRQPTWMPIMHMPEWFPFAGTSLLSLDLDHILVSPEIGVIDCRAEQSTGSDHVPVSVTLALTFDA